MTLPKSRPRFPVLPHDLIRPSMFLLRRERAVLIAPSFRSLTVLQRILVGPKHSTTYWSPAEGQTFAICYQRYMLRYPLENFDDGEVPPEIVIRRTRGHAAGTSDFNFPLVKRPSN